MRLVTFTTAGDVNPRCGIVVDGKVADLRQAASAMGLDAPGSLVELLERGARGMAVARDVDAAIAIGHVETVDEAAVTLLPAVPNPPTIFLFSANYRPLRPEPESPPVDKTSINPRPFLKPGTAVIGPGDPILIPPDSDTLDYEVEIAAVIGSGGRMIPIEDAPSHIAGYMVFNDLSARNLTFSEGRTERDGDGFFDWMLGKWCDSFAVVGPYLVTSDEIDDPRDLEMSLRVNGELRQHSSAGEMIFTVPETIAFLSRFVTLRPGDILSMGTPGAVGDTATSIQPGDVVETSIEKLGAMSNTVARASGKAPR